MMMRAAVLILSLLLSASGALARSDAAGRVALVIGNQHYLNGPELKNPVSDARAVAATLRGLGFSVIFASDQNLIDFGRALQRFDRAMEGAELALFFYAGHGVQVNGATYLIPTDGKMTSPADLATAITVNEVAERMRSAPRAGVVLIDSCRDNPFYSSRQRSFATSETGSVDGPAVGLFLGYASQPGATADDGAGDHSPFTAALLDALRIPDLELEVLMRKVRYDVTIATGGTQVPWSQSSLLGPVVLNDSTRGAGDGIPRDRMQLARSICEAAGDALDGCRDLEAAHAERTEP